MKTIKIMLEDLTFDDLRVWAGEKIFGRGRDYVDRVLQLSRTADNALAAWVSGSDEYATMVRRNGESEFDFNCTCPYDGWGPCKHVVAVLLAAAGQVKRNQEIPLLDPEDDLHLELFDDLKEDEDLADEGGDEDLDDGKPAKGRSSQVASILAGKSREELLAMLSELAAHHPEVERTIRESAQLERGQVDRLVRSLRKEIRNLTAEDAWFNPWKDEGNLPDYSHVEEQLRALLDKGHADAVMQLGEELWNRGGEQVGHSDDEGETAMALAGCMEIVLQALPLTSLTPPEQLLWIINRILEDEYDLLEGADRVLQDAAFTEADWRVVAGDLEARLQAMKRPQSGQFSETCQRENVMGQLQAAYRQSGQQEKIIPLLEKEVDVCRSYEALVDALIEAGERDKARRWCIDGFAKTLKEYPGIAGGLQERLRQMADEEGKYDLVAAYRAEDFFKGTSRQAYTDLRQAAEKIQVWPMVQDGVFAYLQTGQRPATGGKGKNIWPLPEPEVKRPHSQGKPRLESFPNREMLIEIALLEKRLDDAVEIYRELSTTRRWGRAIDEELAQAVAASHPEVALQIWKNIADRLIGQVKPKAYQDAAVYLRRMRKVYEETGCLDDWQALIIRLRTEHKAKRRLQEVLDGLEKNRKLID
jgi:uncharacterized Zn finger protein